MDSVYSNVIVNTLFGWVKGLADWVWYILKDGEDISFLAWFGDNWLTVLIFFLLVGVVLDYLVWILRWRPYLIWRTKIRKFTNALRGKSDQGDSYSRTKSMHETGKYNIARAVNTAEKRLVNQRQQEYIDNSDDDFREYVPHDAKTQKPAYDDNQYAAYEADDYENEYYNKPKTNMNKRGKRKTAKVYTPPIQYMDDMEEQDEYLDHVYEDNTIDHQYEEQYYDEDIVNPQYEQNEEGLENAFEKYSDNEYLDEEYVDEQYVDQAYSDEVYDQYSNGANTADEDDRFYKQSELTTDKGSENEPYDDFEHYEELEYYADDPEHDDEQTAQANDTLETEELPDQTEDLTNQSQNNDDEEVYFLNNQPMRKRIRSKK